MIKGISTSVKCLNCGANIEYWVCENPLALVKDENLKYTLVVGCKGCSEQLYSHIDVEIYRAPQEYAELMAKNVNDYQRRKRNDTQ